MYHYGIMKFSAFHSLLAVAFFACSLVCSHSRDGQIAVGIRSSSRVPFASASQKVSLSANCKTRAKCAALARMKLSAPTPVFSADHCV